MRKMSYFSVRKVKLRANGHTYSRGRWMAGSTASGIEGSSPTGRRRKRSGPPRRFRPQRPAINGGEITRISKLENIDRIIDLKTGVIRIIPELAKTMDVRQIVIQPCLHAWLTRYPIARFPIIPPSASNLLAEVRRKFSLGHDVLRHVFISMHVARFRSMGETALQAGNSEAIIKKPYLNLVSPEEADSFWKIVPAG
jgi:hypothetical protein